MCQAYIFSPTARHNRTLVSLSPESHTCNHHAQPAPVNVTVACQLRGVDRILTQAVEELIEFFPLPPRVARERRERGQRRPRQRRSTEAGLQQQQQPASASKR